MTTGGLTGSERGDHPVFDRFLRPGEIISAPPGFKMDSFLGTKFRGEFNEAAFSQVVDAGARPPVDEEYFEWIDVLESVVRARQSYTMFELGAGYGRWSIRAAAAARMVGGLRVRLVAVEPEPRHFKWLKQNLKDHGLRPRDHVLAQGVVNATGENTEITIGMPEELASSDQPDQWYGQSVYWGELRPRRFVVGRGRLVTRTTAEGWRLQTVRGYTLVDLLREHAYVDLIDMDLQGAELEVVTASIDPLTSKVARIHIGTHSAEIEEGLRSLLASRGWVCASDYPCGKSVTSEFGPVTFGDGVQTWTNPTAAHAHETLGH